MKSLFYLFIIIFLSSAFTSCKEIIAEDITNRIPVLILPAVSDTVMQNPVQFKWEAMEGATKYHLQVVSPSFSTISDYVLDTIITGTTFSFPMDSAVFELKLTAMNGGYSSQTLGPIQFWVGIAPTINTSSVVLQAPIDALYVNGTFNGPFTWQTLSGATSYEYSLRKGAAFATGTIEHTQNNITPQSYTLPGMVILSEGTYYWGVKAYTAASETNFTTRTFKVDVTAPNAPTLISPNNLSLLNAGIIPFSWSNGVDGGTIQAPIRSYIEVSIDPAFATIDYASNIIGNTTNLDLSVGFYYWRAYNLDDAGNVSFYSTVNTISVN